MTDKNVYCQKNMKTKKTFFMNIFFFNFDKQVRKRKCLLLKKIWKQKRQINLNPSLQLLSHDFIEKEIISWKGKILKTTFYSFVILTSSSRSLWFYSSSRLRRWFDWCLFDKNERKLIWMSFMYSVHVTFKNEMKFVMDVVWDDFLVFVHAWTTIHV